MEWNSTVIKSLLTHLTSIFSTPCSSGDEIKIAGPEIHRETNREGEKTWSKLYRESDVTTRLRLSRGSRCGAGQRCGRGGGRGP